MKVNEGLQGILNWHQKQEKRAAKTVAVILKMIRNAQAKLAKKVAKIVAEVDVRKLSIRILLQEAWMLPNTGTYRKIIAFARQKNEVVMAPKKPIKPVIVAAAVLILTFGAGFVTGGIQKTYQPEDCNNTLREQE